MDTGLVMVFVGKYLSDKTYDSISAQDLQKFIKDDNSVGYNLPLDQCRTALEWLTTGGFIEKVSEHPTNPIFCFVGGKPIKREEEKVFDAEVVGKRPLYAPGI